MPDASARMGVGTELIMEPVNAGIIMPMMPAIPETDTKKASGVGGYNMNGVPNRLQQDMTMQMKRVRLSFRYPPK